MKHWTADRELADLPPHKGRGKRLRAPSGLERWARVDSFEPPRRASRQAERSGALAGLLLVATACAGFCFLLYQVAAPADVFVKADRPID